MRGKLIILVSLLIAFGLGVFCVKYYDKEETTVVNNTTKETTGVVKCNDKITIDESGISTAVGEIYDATVTIQNYQNNKLAGTGSGFVYKKDSKYGYIMTNHHVIDGSDKLIVTMSNDDQVEATLLGSDQYLDIAVIRIDVKNVKQVATIGSSENTNVGDTVITVGSPIGYDYRGSVTRGTLSGKNRMIEVSIKTTNDFVMRVLQIDAAINPGNSGGPLVNIKGEVIGINSLKLVEDRIEGMGFAIPIEYAMSFVDDLEKGKELERPFIGITMLNATDTYRLYQNGIRLSNDIEEGVVIVNISEGSGADKAGLQRGDVITSINGNKVSNVAYLKYELYKSKVGDTVEIKILRDKKEKTVKVTLTKIEE